MLGVILSILIIFFGIFLKITQIPSLQSSKKMSWLFIALGIFSLAGKIVLHYI